MVLELKKKLTSLVKAALEKKAENIVVLDVKTISSYADYIVICSGSSTVQVQTIARFIEENMRREKVMPFGVEGIQGGQWILMDYGDIVFHIFYKPVRVFYNLEGLYIDAPRYNPFLKKGRQKKDALTSSGVL